MGTSSYRLDEVEMNEVHHTALVMVARRMQAESDEDEFVPTYEPVVKYALQMTARGLDSN